MPLVTVEVIQHQPALLGLLVATCYPQPNQKLRRLQSSADCRLKVILYSSQSSQTYSARINSVFSSSPAVIINIPSLYHPASLLFFRSKYRINSAIGLLHYLLLFSSSPAVSRDGLNIPSLYHPAPPLFFRSLQNICLLKCVLNETFQQYMLDMVFSFVCPPVNVMVIVITMYNYVYILLSYTHWLLCFTGMD